MNTANATCVTKIVKVDPIAATLIAATEVAPSTRSVKAYNGTVRAEKIAAVKADCSARLEAFLST